MESTRKFLVALPPKSFHHHVHVMKQKQTLHGNATGRHKREATESLGRPIELIVAIKRGKCAAAEWLPASRNPSEAKSRPYPVRVAVYCNLLQFQALLSP